MLTMITNNSETETYTSLNENTDSSSCAANSAASQCLDSTAICSASNGNFFNATKKSSQKTKVNLDYLIKEQTMISASMLERAKSVSGIEGSH
jgi:hypothetical protein